MPQRINFDPLDSLIEKSEKYKHRDECNVTSRTIKKDLEKYGVVPNKTLIAEAKNGINENKHFWRGMVDGDGWVWINKKNQNNHSTGLSGTKTILDQFLKHINENVFVTKQKPYKFKHANCYMITFDRSQADKLLDYLYKDSNIYLERKYNKYKEIINNKENNT